MKIVILSAADTEVGELFHNIKSVGPIRAPLEEFGNIKQTTPIQIDNSTKDEIVNDTIKKKIINAMDMRFYWVQDIIFQGHYNVFWKPGATNLDEYFIKQNPPHHHNRMHPVYLQCPGITNNSSARVYYSSQNTIKNYSKS